MEITKTIISVIELVPGTITSILQETKGKMPLSPDDESEFRLILEEAIVNAIRHGNDCNTSLKVQIKITFEEDILIMTVADEGQGFDYNALSDPLKESEALATSGRGIFLIKQMSDEVTFNETGSEITIIKKLKKVN